MTKGTTILALAFFAVLFASPTAVAQTDDVPKCKGRIYSAEEEALTRRARIARGPNYDAIFEAFGRDVRARAVLDVVLCESGQVTDIKVIEVTPPEITDFLVKATSIRPFRPAEIGWRTVSQWQRFEYRINYGNTTIDMTSADGRLVESVDFVGSRKLITRTSFWIVGKVKFEGLKVDRSKVIEALKKESVMLQPKAVYSAALLTKTVQLIELFLASTGQGSFKVEPRTENVSDRKVNITFVITPKQ